MALFALFNALNIKSVENLNFAACVLLELYVDENKNISVELHFRNGPSANEFTQLPIPGCSDNTLGVCTLGNFLA